MCWVHALQVSSNPEYIQSLKILKEKDELVGLVEENGLITLKS